MYRLWAIDEEMLAARRTGARYMLVCFDVWDRQRGDEDFGYYYPHFATAPEVRDFLARVQLDEDRTGYADVCEAVIDLGRMGERFDEALSEKPSVWLVRLSGLN